MIDNSHRVRLRALLMGSALPLILLGCGAGPQQNKAPQEGTGRKTKTENATQQSASPDNQNHPVPGQDGDATSNSDISGSQKTRSTEQQSENTCLDTPENNCHIAAIVLKLTNDFRAENQLPPFKAHPKLAWLAYFWAIEQGKRGVPDHSGWNSGLYAQVYPEHFNEPLPLVRAENAGMAQLSMDPEEVGREMFIMWRDSPTHRKNLLSRYQYMGIGLEVGAPAGIAGYYDWYGTQILTNDSPK